MSTKKSSEKYTIAPPLGYGVQIEKFGKDWLVVNEDGEILDTTRYDKRSAIKAAWKRVELDTICEVCDGEGEIHDADFSDGDSDRMMYYKQDTLRDCPNCKD